MSNSATSSSAQPSISSKPPHTVDKPADSPPADPKPSYVLLTLVFRAGDNIDELDRPMSSGGAPSKQPPSASNTRGNVAPSPTGAPAKPSNTAKPPPPKPPPPPSTKNNAPKPTVGSTNPPKSPSGSPASPTKPASTVVTGKTCSISRRETTCLKLSFQSSQFGHPIHLRYLRLSPAPQKQHCRCRVRFL